MRVSVALCTFNGSRHLPEQLHSLAEQDRPPDEVVVCDDRSTDETPTVLESFAGRAPFPVRWEINRVNLGSTASFARAIERCEGEVIALCDQDDFWEPGKLARLERVLVGAPAAGLVCSDARLVDDRLRPLGHTLWESIAFSAGQRRRFVRGDAFAVLLRRYRITGATLAFRSSFRPLILPIPTGWVHDAWIALLIAASAECRLVDEPLVRYRQHPRQQIGGRRPGLYDRYLIARDMGRVCFAETADRYACALDRLRGHPGVPARNLGLLEEKVRHFRRRAEMRDPGAGRLRLIATELLRGRYGRYSQGWKALAQDLFLA